MPNAVHVTVNSVLELMQSCSKEQTDNLLHADKAFSIWIYSPEAENQHCLSCYVDLGMPALHCGLLGMLKGWDKPPLLQSQQQSAKIGWQVQAGTNVLLP